MINTHPFLCKDTNEVILFTVKYQLFLKSFKAKQKAEAKKKKAHNVVHRLFLLK